MTATSQVLRSAAIGIFVVVSIGPGVAQPRSYAVPQSVCNAPAGWTTHGAVSPPRPSSAPDSRRPCEFYVLAWHTFLWLTQPEGPDGRPRFLNFPGPAETFAAEGVSSERFAARVVPKVLTLQPRDIKSSGLSDFNSINQAGGRGVLVARDGRAVYYSVNVNPVYYNFIRENKYYDPIEYDKAPAAKTFPIGALEFKYAWRIVDDGEDHSKFFTIKAAVQLLVERDGKVEVDEARTKMVTVALVGVHIAGIVKDHPEFIWATFEHVDNAPDLPPGMSAASPNPVSDRDWTFYAAGIPAKESNKDNAHELRLIDAATQKLRPITHIFRQFPWGGMWGDANAQNIRTLNDSVRTRTLASDPIWRNYMLIGATWLSPNSLEPGKNYGSGARGSVLLSNSTMETFVQSGNCFGCHSTEQQERDGVNLSAKNLNLSHILINAAFRNRRASKAAAPR